MALSDCEKCWQTPCCCGWDYKGWDAEELSDHIAAITQYRTKEDAKAIIEKALKIVEGSQQATWKPHSP